MGFSVSGWYKSLSKYERYALYLIILGTLIRIFISFIVHPSGDGAWHMSVARFIAEHLKIPLFEPLGRDFFWSPPLFHIITAAFYSLFSIFGSSTALIGAKLVSPIFSGIATLASFLIIKHFYGNKMAFYSTLFLTFLPDYLYLSTIPYLDVTFTAFFLLAIYFALKKRYAASAVFTGLATLTKYHGVLAILIVTGIIYLNEKFKIKHYLKYYAISIPISGIWLIRNYLVSGNPVWPFFNNILGIPAIQTVTSLSNFVSLDIYKFFIFDTLSVPAGNLRTFSMVNIPYINILSVLWLIGSFIYFVPILFGFNKLKKHAGLFVIWLLPFFLFFIFSIYGNALFLRYFFPVLPVLAILWAEGFRKISKINFKLVIVIFILLAVCLTSVEVAKTYAATSYWNKYEADFNWISENTPVNSTILVKGGETASYNLHRLTPNYNGNITQLMNVDYVVGYPFTDSSSYDENFTKYLYENTTLVFKDNKTGVILFKIPKSAAFVTH